MYKLTFVLLLVSNLANAQNWKDTIVSARKAYQKGNSERALKQYHEAENLVKQENKGVDLNEEKGQTAYKNRDFKSAEDYYQKSIANKKNNFDKSKSYHNLGNTQFKQQKYDEAIASYKQALKLNPNQEQTRYNLSEAIRMKKNQDAKNENSKKNQSKPNQKENENQQNSQKNKPGDQAPGVQNKKSNKEIERMLDEISKSEAKTKRKVSGQKGEEGNKDSKKDW